MKIVKCEVPPPRVADVNFLQGHLYQGKQMKQMYLCIDVAEDKLRLVDLQGSELKVNSERSLYDDVTDKWELKEKCDAS